ncbi:hypothetical protein CLV63_12948 [Murinocardiopsis flavida]|uniref:Uncharacterized protein n=1 Tax=Murinocardiopsis flavida TaxID=645275 RepID=A0A2P8CUZ0_9ACTN|nr:hypothetical protein [Murinocardiopsis flavida]PSK88759.1 hypothetical protein CLV63_12948 [Murinocardiopsis flavida]
MAAPTTVRTQPASVRSAGSGLLLLAAVVWLLHLAAPADWTLVAFPTLALVGTGLRVEAAIRDGNDARSRPAPGQDRPS